MECWSVVRERSSGVLAGLLYVSALVECWSVGCERSSGVLAGLLYVCGTSSGVLAAEC